MVLNFFDNEGCPIIFYKNSDGYNEVDIYLEPVSVSLYENFNIYVMEKYASEDGDAYRFPILDENERYLFRWDNEDDEIPEYFLYDIEHNKTDNTYYINKQMKEYLFEYVDRNIRAPFQLNVGFSPNEEISYRKTLLVIHEVINEDNQIDQTLECRINFYSEGIEEDVRFKIQLENFGIKLNKTDALAIKDYNVSEAYPDWEIVNSVRKHLILEKEELVPYLGTYRCLKNIISLFGYGDSIDVREYYKNINPASEYFGKYSIVSISDFLDNGKVDSMNLVDKNVAVKDNSDFQKCGMLALAYEFTKKSGKYDDNGIPELERSDEFSTNEMFFKLHKMKDILERDYLPVNVFVCDVIGEWSYYVSFSRYVWSDRLEIINMNLNSKISVGVYPEVNRHIYDVSMLHTKRYSDSDYTNVIEGKENAPKGYYAPESESMDNSVIDVPIKYVNDMAVPKHISETILSTDNFYGKVYKVFSEQTGIPSNNDDMELLRDYSIDVEGYGTITGIDFVCDAVKSFYEEYRSKGFDEIFDKRYNYVNNYRNPIGFPAILTVELEKIKIEDLKYVRICDFGIADDDSMKQRTWNDIYFRNYVDIAWHIEYKNTVDRVSDTFSFDYEAPIKNAYHIPVLLPYTGAYDVSVKVRDIYGLVSYSYNDSLIVVEEGVPQVVATYPGDDVFEFTIDNLKYVSYKDFGANNYITPRVNVLDNITDSDVVLDPNVISSSEILSYANDTEVYNYASGDWEPLSESGDQNSDNFGFGDYKALRFSDFKGARVIDMFHVRPVDCVMSSDVLYGFWFANFNEGDEIIYEYHIDESDNKSYTIPSGTAEQICRKMNDFDGGNLPEQLRLFTYYPVRPNKMDIGAYEGIDESFIESGKYIIVAEARHFSRFGAMKIGFSGDSIIGSNYTFERPLSGYDKSIELYTESGKSPEFLSTAIDAADYYRYGDSVFTYEYLTKCGYVCNDSILDGSESRGYVPMLCDTNIINQNTCKLHTESFSIPLFKRVIFFINNVVGKNSSSIEWTLKDIYGNVVIKVRNNPYFIYNFNELGNYELDVYIKDNNNNVYKSEFVKFINVLGYEDYIKHVQYKLMNRQNK